MARWQFCNILHVGPDACRLWQFDAKGDGFALNREHTGAVGEPLPFNLVARSWRSLWQPRLNVAWLPPENVFLRVIELPRSNFQETLAMVELQLEKLSPLPVAQVVWMIHVLPPTTSDLQTVIVVIAARHPVEEFLGKLEGQGYLADRLEAPMLDELAASPATEDGAWIYPAASAGQNVALVAWWFGGALRNLSFVVLSPTGDRAKSLKDQLAQLTWAGELEGWLTASPAWHLVAAGAVASEWEGVLLASLGEPVQVTPPLAFAELAARTARRSTQSDTRSTMLPSEFSTRYHQQFVDRLWLRGLAATGILYAIGVADLFLRDDGAGVSGERGGATGGGVERPLHRCVATQGALRRAQATAGFEIRGLGLLEDRGRTTARGPDLATAEFCRRPAIVAERNGPPG